MRFYVASRIENRVAVAQLVDALVSRGHACTYDWSVHGSVQGEPDRWAPTAEDEARGVLDADVVAVLLPGGRGTHVEIGLAIAGPQTRLALVGEEVSRDGRTCVFYHHPKVERFDDVAELLEWVDAVYPPVRRRTLLVGELNPYGSDPKMALFPWPKSSSGGRLCRAVLGLTPREYLNRFDRVNLCEGHWDADDARARAATIRESLTGDSSTVLLGAKVCKAFGADYEPFLVERGSRGSVVILPHPSGLCRAWNEPDAVERAREALRKGGVAL